MDADFTNLRLYLTALYPPLPSSPAVREEEVYQ